MICREFLDAWNEHFDSPRSGSDPECVRAMKHHAAECPECAALAVGFAVMEQGLPALTPPRVPADLVDRILLAHDEASRPRMLRNPVRIAAVIAGLAAAASLAIVLWKYPAPRPGGKGPEIARAAPGLPPRPLSIALAEATSATLDLALATSAPAARTGQRVFLSTQSEAGEASWPTAVPSGSASDVLHSVGQGVESGVRPLSGTARRAFGFLIGPASPSARVDPGSGRSGA